MKLTLSQMHEKRMKLKYVKWEKGAKKRFLYIYSYYMFVCSEHFMCVNHHGSSNQHIATDRQIETEEKHWICQKFTGGEANKKEKQPKNSNRSKIK